MLYQNLKEVIDKIIIDHTSVDHRLTLICEVLQENIDYYDWVGFYFANHKEQTLHLKAFAGEPTDHTVIPFGKGICGQVAISNQNFVVEDVKAQDNYIACSINVKAEIVIPLFKNGVNVGQIDIDSNTADPFTQKDVDFLEWINVKVAKIL
jgi:L-methionine (R)-S-oxide reductase